MSIENFQKDSRINRPKSKRASPGTLGDGKCQSREGKERPQAKRHRQQRVAGYAIEESLLELDLNED